MGTRATHIIGLDCGTSVIKAALFDADGQEKLVSPVAWEGISPHAGWMEYRPEDLWSATCRALRQLMAKADVPADSIAAICPTGAGNGLLTLDADGKPIRNGIFAVDARSADMIAAELGSDFASRVQALNGQTAWTGQSFVVLRWLARNEPQAYRRIARLMPIKDYVRLRLSGQYVADASEMSKLGLMDIGRGQPSRELFSLYGVEDMVDRIAPIQPSTAIVGEVSAEAADATGLAAGTPVANGLADIDASALGSGVVRPGQMSIVAGTWSINQLFIDRPVLNPKLFGLSFYAVEGVYEQLEASPSSTANLTWFVKHACGDLEERASREGRSVYDVINELVATVPPASTAVMFHPYLYGSNANVHARAGFYGLAGWQDKAQLLSALFEGVVFSHNTHVEKLLAGGAKVDEVRLSGGAANSRLWSQMFSDMLGLPVAVAAAHETGALGAAICAAVGAGIHRDVPSAAARMARVARTHRPDMAMHARYARRYATYKRVTELMGGVWDELWRYGADATA